MDDMDTIWVDEGFRKVVGVNFKVKEEASLL